MWLILTTSLDPCGPWLKTALIERGVEPVEWITDCQLAAARRWVHRVGVDGSSVIIELADGRVIDSRAVTGAINRLSMIPREQVLAVRAADRAYAEHELYAFYLSWLACLPGPVLNPPDPQGFCGAWLHPLRMARLAAEAGVPCVPVCLDSETQPGMYGATTAIPLVFQTLPRMLLLAAGARVCGTDSGAAAQAEQLAAPILRFAALARCPILGLEFAIAADAGASLLTTTPLPDLRRGGEPVADALAEALGAATMAEV
jgi:hypothetical protein